ncbi:MAG: glycerol-3-phosphate acyltransferase, partial [Clostridia bacterium]|nr:glycerol-3-phosphate acyltransferase [Clostridia bacterium]
MFSFLQEGLFSRLFPNNILPETGAWLFYLAYFGFALIVIVSSYLLGSVNTAIVVSKTLYRDDIRKHGSGNAGLTNMLRTYGKGAAGLTLLGDLLKTAIAVLIAAVFWGFNYVGGISTSLGFCYIAGLFAVVGHIFPIYYKFKGGKG